jgi:hypothetical protein
MSKLQMIKQAVNNLVSEKKQASFSIISCLIDVKNTTILSDNFFWNIQKNINRFFF